MENAQRFGCYDYNECETNARVPAGPHEDGKAVRRTVVPHTRRVALGMEVTNVAVRYQRIPQIIKPVHLLEANHVSTRLAYLRQHQRQPVAPLQALRGRLQGFRLGFLESCSRL